MATTVQYVSIQDSNATPSSTFFAFSSTNAGNNTGWSILSGLGCSLAATDAPDTAAIEINNYSYLYLQTTDAVDTAAFNISNYNLILTATEATDTAVFNASISSTLSMAATETPDSYAQNAYILWLTPTQPDDPTIWVPKNDPTPYLTTVI